jgi:hypothetical protein
MASRMSRRWALEVIDFAASHLSSSKLMDAFRFTASGCGDAMPLIPNCAPGNVIDNG